MATSLTFAPRRQSVPLQRKLADLNWFIVLVIVAIATIGIAMLYSVSDGSMDPWASRQAIRFVVALALLITIAVTDIRVWMSLAYPAYFAGLILLLLVEIIGATGMGGQRWLDFGITRLQPSEMMKIATIMAIARYYHSLSLHEAARLKSLFPPLVIIAVPCALVLRQPDLGTAIMLILGGIGLIFLSGARMWIFVSGFFASIAAIPVGWNLLRGYQRARIEIFLNPELDPSGAGYQITQSKIALGSGGLFGKGFLQGTQVQLDFLPEMRTDFIFSVLAEEFGLVGGMTLVLLYFILLGYGLLVSAGCRNHFGRLLAAGMSVTIFLYVFINIAMVMGLVPVVGVPLPLVSYGGSSMLTVMVALGLILSVNIHRNLSIPRRDPFG